MMQDIYLIALLPYVPFWLYIYLRSAARTRKEMVFMSTLVAIISPVASYLWWNKDWWLPPSIFGGQVYTIIPEDILLGFVFGGIAAVIYEFYFHKKLNHNKHSHKKGFAVFVLLTVIICWTLFSLFKFNSFYSIVISTILVSLGVFSMRRDLIKSSFYSGILTLIIALPFYFVIHLIAPDWAFITYKYEFLSGFTIYDFPIEEFIFWFFYGLTIGPAYEYLKGWSFK
jgi:hypothetical protein